MYHFLREFRRHDDSDVAVAPKAAVWHQRLATHAGDTATVDELIDQITAETGIDASVARKATGIILSFLSHEGPPDAVAAVLDDMPGARELAAETGGGRGGLMMVFASLTGAGLGMGDIQGVAGSILNYARAKAGDDKVNAVIAAIPSLQPFV